MFSVITHFKSSVTVISDIYWTPAVFRALCWEFKKCKTAILTFLQDHYQPELINTWKNHGLGNLIHRPMSHLVVKPGYKFSSVWFQSYLKTSLRQTVLFSIPTERIEPLLLTPVTISIVQNLQWLLGLKVSPCETVSTWAGARLSVQFAYLQRFLRAPRSSTITEWILRRKYFYFLVLCGTISAMFYRIPQRGHSGSEGHLLTPVAFAEASTVLPYLLPFAVSLPASVTLLPAITPQINSL